jgi:hypothetical protein
MSTQLLRKLEGMGRLRLSRNFFMRDFLHSEVAAINGIVNQPTDFDLAVFAGRHLCEELLEPLQTTFGRIHIRSGYRSAELNAYCHEHRLGRASNDLNRAHHIWDLRDADGYCGASACIVIPWFIDRYSEPGDWQRMAWWIHDHLPYSTLKFFSKLSAFNIGWHEKPKRRIDSVAYPRGCLTKPGMANHAGSHAALYRGFPELRLPG